VSFIGQPISISALIFGKTRQFGEFTGYVTNKEETNDTLTITKQPIQDGASITDHAFQEPTVLSMTILMQNSGLSAFSGTDGLAQLYQSLLDLQSSRVPFTVKTPKRTYDNMLLAVIGLTTDKNTENILALNLSFQEILIVSISTVSIDPMNQASPKVTQPTKKVGNKSILSTLFGGNLQQTISKIGGG